MTDKYEYQKSCLPQGVDTETPYVSKQWNYVNDINSSVYSNTGSPTLVQFDLSSIYNSSQFIDVSQMYITIPITYVTAWTSATGALLAPPTGAWAATGLKNGYFNLVHGMDLMIGGKTISQFQPNINAYIGFKLMSQMSQDDLKTLGATLGMGASLDNWQSQRFNGSGTVGNTGASAGVFPNITVNANPGFIGGNGMSNNAPFALAGTSNFGDQTILGLANNTSTGVYNNGYYSRLAKIVDTSTAYAVTSPNIYGTGTNGTQNISNAGVCMKEFKPYFTTLPAGAPTYAVWYDVAVIRLCDILDAFKYLPLTKKFDATLRMYINTGTVVSQIVAAAATASTIGQLVTSASGISFTNTCPLIQSAILAPPLTAVSVASGLFIATPTTTSISVAGGVVNLAGAAASHFMTACRCYFPQITLKPQYTISYVSENRAKKVCYTEVLTNTIANVGASSTISYLVQSGVTNVRGVLIMPFISSNSNAANAHGTISTGTFTISSFSELQSPFDTAPMTNAPISLINLQVAVGGVNILQNTYSYTYENFIQQVSLYEKINSSDLGLSCGLINQEYYDNAYRVYYVDCSRANNADMHTPRNVNITFTNNSLQTIDCLIFTEYFKELVIDVETGLIETL